MANPIQFNQIADLEKGIQKAIADFERLESTTKKVFQSMATEGEKLERSLKDSTGNVSKLKTQFEQLNPAIEKDREKIVGLNQVLSNEVAIIKDLNGAQNGLAKTQKVASDSVDGLKKRVSDLTKEFNKLSASSDGKKIKALGAEITKTRQEMKNLTDATRRTVNTFNSAKGSYNDLVQQNAKLSAILRRLPVEFVQTNRRAQQLVATMNANTIALKQFDAAIGRSFRNVGNYPRLMGAVSQSTSTAVTAFTGLQLGVLGAGLAFQQAVSANAEYSDALAGVQKTTDLTKDEVAALGAELKEINTRTAVTELLGIAKAAGRFQISKSQLASFTEEVDKLIVALSDDLGGDADQITTDVTKIAEVFGTLTPGNEAKAITSLGSAVNELGNNTKAQAPFILDFTKRVQGVAATVDLSLPFILGLGATLDELGVSAEVSSTVLNKLFVEIGNADRFDDFSKLIGVTTEEFEKLIAQSPEETFVRILEAAQSNKEGFAALSDVLEDLGVDGQRSSQVLTALTKNTEKLTDRVKLSNEAYKEGTSLQEEFDTQNNTLGASLDKLSNAFFNATTSSGLFAAAIKGLIDSLTFLLTFDFDLINSIFTSDTTLKELAALEKQMRALKQPAQEVVDEFLKLSEADQNNQLGELTRLITKASDELEKLENQSGRTRAQNRDKIENLKDTIEALENEYVALKDAQKQQQSVQKESTDEIANSEPVIKRTTHNVRALTKEMQGFVEKMHEIRKAVADPAGNFDQEAIFGDLEGEGRAMLDNVQKFLKLRGEQEERLTKKMQDEEDLRRRAIQESIDLAIDSTNILFNIRVDNLARELQALEDQKRNELQIIGDNEAARVETEDRFAARERELREKQAKAEKAQALFNIAVGTAEGIAQTIGTFGIPLALPFVAVLTALGIAQAAAVSSQPIPAFAEGGISPGGVILAGEKGPELIQTGPGEFHRVDRPSLVDTPRGAQIFDAVTTRRMEDNVISRQTLNSWDINYPDQKSYELNLVRRIQYEINQSNQEVVRAIRSIPGIKEKLGVKETYLEVTRGNEKRNYLTKKYRYDS